MLFKSYRKKIFRPECNPGFESVHCIAHLDQDISEVLPRTNCKECGEPTCMVFAARVVEGVKTATDCPPIDADNRKSFEEYMGRFNF
jgi:ArsR family metal-binding transcriptional regulator